MDVKKFSNGAREIWITSLSKKAEALPAGKFAVLLPAYDDVEFSLCIAAASEIINFQCIEFCCVGKMAEKLHDRIDEIIEDCDKLDVVTTHYLAPEEACEYFFYAVDAGEPDLFAMIAGHPEIESSLLAIANHESYK